MKKTYIFWVFSISWIKKFPIFLYFSFYFLFFGGFSSFLRFNVQPWGQRWSQRGEMQEGYFTGTLSLPKPISLPFPSTSYLTCSYKAWCPSIGFLYSKNLTLASLKHSSSWVILNALINLHSLLPYWKKILILVTFKLRLCPFSHLIYSFRLNGLYPRTSCSSLKFDYAQIGPKPNCWYP